MKIVLHDHENLCSGHEREYVQRRLFFGLARFAFRVNSVVVQFSTGPGRTVGQVRCQVKVDIEGRGMVVTERTAADVTQSASQAVDTIESRVALRVDGRRRWFKDYVAGGHMPALLRPSWIFSSPRGKRYSN